MDISPIELKSMKAKQLRRLVREMINEIKLNEDAAADKASQDAHKIATTKQLQALQKQKAEIASNPVAPDQKPAKDAEKMAIDRKIAYLQKKMKDLNEPGISPLDINEMARIAKGFKLADDSLDTAQYADKRISGVSLSTVLDYIKENPGIEIKALQTHFGFARPQMVNALVKGLMDAGILRKLGAGGEEIAPVAPGEEAPTQATEPEDLFMGSSENPLSMYFDDKPNANGEEDFNDDEEPTIDDIEVAPKVNVSNVSPEDMDASYKYTELERRLAAVKSNILKMKRSKSTAGDISDKPSTELQRLRDLKTSLEQRINDLIDSNDYVKKLAGVEVPEAPAVELGNEEEEEEPINESYDLRKLQYYAGIIK
jgi:hypothetical protein